MPKKNRLTPDVASKLKTELHDTRMRIFTTRQRLQQYFNGDTQVVQEARRLYQEFAKLETDCQVLIEAKKTLR